MAFELAYSLHMTTSSWAFIEAALLQNVSQVVPFAIVVLLTVGRTKAVVMLESLIEEVCPSVGSIVGRRLECGVLAGLRGDKVRYWTNCSFSCRSRIEHKLCIVFLVHEVMTHHTGRLSLVHAEVVGLLLLADETGARAQLVLIFHIRHMSSVGTNMLLSEKTLNWLLHHILMESFRS